MGVQGFRRTITGRVVLRVDEIEGGLLTTLLEQLIEFVAPADDGDVDPLVALVGIDPNARPSDDPALARLLPDAYLDDSEAAGEFRRFTERSLRDLKVANATTALETLRRSGATAGREAKVTLTQDEATAWLGALNDLRLALGTRLGVCEEGMDELAALDDDDPRGATFHVYDWLTYLQESLVQSMMPS